MIKNIIFDIGNVLIHFDWAGFLRRNGATEEEIDIIGKKAVSAEIWRTMDEGAVPFDEVLATLKKEVGPACEHWIPFMLDHYDGLCSLLPYTMDWLRDLKARGYHLYCLSNFSDVGFNNAKRGFPFLDVVDGYLISYEVKLMKPSKAIFDALCDKYQLQASECIMIDDLLENVEGAKNAGLHGLQWKNFRTPEIYQKELDEMLEASKKE